MALRIGHEPKREPNPERDPLVAAVFDEAARLHRTTAELAEQVKRLGALSELMRQSGRKQKGDAPTANRNVA